MIDRENKSNIITIAAQDADFPKSLKAIPSPCKEIFCMGDKSLLDSPCIAIVGTRTPSQYGVQAAKMFARSLAEAGLTIVSGLARGIDSVAHAAALEAEGKTIAVLGGGINKIYPAENRTLAARIAKKGLLVSEYAPDTLSAAFHFPVRNRIIAGLSMGVLIIEAGERSGTLNTASHALAQDKDLFVVPGSIFSRQSKGTNKLLKDLQGAIVTEAKDILKALDMEEKEAAPRNILFSPEEARVLSIIEQKGEAHFEEIAEVLGEDTGTVLVLLSTMELKGIITKTEGNFYMEIK